TIVPLLVGMTITLGFVELMYDGLNLVTSSFMSVLMGLGIDFGVHILLRYKEERGAGHAVHPALGAALRATGPAIVAGGGTTLFAFLTTTVTEFAAFRALGIITAVGLLVMLACAFLLVPPLVPLLAGQRNVSPREMPGVSRLANWVARRARWVLAGTVLATLLTAASLASGLPSFNGRYFDFLPKQTESYRALQIIQRAGTPPAEAHFVAASFEEARRLTEALRGRPEVSFVQSPSDLLPPETPERLRRLQQAVAESASHVPVLPELSPKYAAERLEAFSDLRDAFDELGHALRQANRDGAPASRIAHELGALIRWMKLQPDQGTAALNRMTRGLSSALSRARETARKIAARGAYAPEDLPPIFKARFVAKDSKRLAVHVYPSGDVWEPGFAERFATSLRALDPEVAGAALNVVPHERYITEGFQRAAVYALLGVAVIVWLTFRRVRDTLLALLPVTLGWLWMLGLMRPLGIEFTPANMVALPLILGLGVDTGVHILHRANEVSGTAKLAALLQGTGVAVSVAALTSIIGFGALTVADYRAMQGLGLLLSLGVGLCLLASVVVLPAVLVLLGRLR
ncbi:MAG TPA: MMPL family transporter, partial [Polyangiaceae bacterium]|nr:MMPL family transporter [Polyangiaceae bacterium]